LKSLGDRKVAASPGFSGNKQIQKGVLMKKDQKSPSSLRQAWLTTAATVALAAGAGVSSAAQAQSIGVQYSNGPQGRVPSSTYYQQQRGGYAQQQQAPRQYKPWENDPEYLRQMEYLQRQYQIDMSRIQADAGQRQAQINNYQSNINIDSLQRLRDLRSYGGRGSGLEAWRTISNAGNAGQDIRAQQQQNATEYEQNVLNVQRNYSDQVHNLDVNFSQMEPYSSMMQEYRRRMAPPVPGQPRR
jgi:hypothetical protein